MNMVINLIILFSDHKLTIHSIEPWFCSTFHSFQGLPKLSNVLNKNASKTFYSEGEVNSGLCSMLRSMIVTQGVQSPSVIITYFFSLILMTLYMKLLIILSSLFVYFAFAFLLTVPRVILRPSGQILQFRQVSHWGPTGRQVC